MIIYLTTNLLNNKKYIGKDSKNNPEYLGSGVLLKKAIKKYGKENFKKEILETCTNINDLNEKEKYFIKIYSAVESDDFYNIHTGGDGGNSMAGKTKEEKSKIYEKILKTKAKKTDEEKSEIYKKISKTKTGKKINVIDRDKFKRAAETRINNGNNKLSEETKAKISKSHIGKIVSEETKNKITKANKGRKIDWSDKISEGLKGKSKTDIHKKNIANQAKQFRWVSNLSLNIFKKINVSQLENYIQNGWVHGRIKN